METTEFGQGLRAALDVPRAPVVTADLLLRAVLAEVEAASSPRPELVAVSH
jgi:hypothetical protein